jgi:hypothetical protein
MPIARKSTKPTGITNESGEPEIVVTVGDLTLSLAPPPAPRRDQQPAEQGDGGSDAKV